MRALFCQKRQPEHRKIIGHTEKFPENQTHLQRAHPGHHERFRIGRIGRLNTNQRSASLITKIFVLIVFLILGFAAGRFLPFFSSQEYNAGPKGTFVDSETIDQDQIYGRWRLAKKESPKDKEREK